MKGLWLAVALLLVASTAAAQKPTCDAQIRTANAMMEELQQQVRLLSARAAQHHGRAQVLSAKLDAAQAEIVRLNRKE